MTESVGGNMLSDAGETGVFFDDTLDRAGSEATEIARSIDFALATAVVKKKWGKGVFALVKVGGNPIGGSRGDKNRTIFAAFTADDKFATVEIDRIAIEFNKFGNAKSAGEK